MRNVPDELEIGENDARFQHARIAAGVELVLRVAHPKHLFRNTFFLSAFSFPGQ
jgi:hypothetical protein